MEIGHVTFIWTLNISLGKFVNFYVLNVQVTSISIEENKLK